MHALRTRLARRLLASAAILALSTQLAGCVSLTEIRAFAATAAGVGESFPALARDFFQSCMSQQRYIVAQKENFRLDKFADLSDPENELMKPGLAICKGFSDQQGRLSAVNATLVGYMRTMGDLSADELTSFDKSIGGFGAALAGADVLEPAEATAVAKVAAYVARVVSEGYRRKQLRTVIVDMNDDIKTVSAALERIVGKNYVLQLENERVAMEAYYRKLAAESARFTRAVVKHSGGEQETSDPASLDQVKSAFETKNTALRTKIAGAKSYASVMKEVAVGHQALRDSVDHLDARATLQTALSEAKTIQALAAEFIAAF